MEIQRNVSLKEYTTFKIGGPASYFCVVKTKNELFEALKFSEENGIPFFILGRGSNLLVSDGGFLGLVIKLENCKMDISDCSGFGKFCRVAVDAGIKLEKLVSDTAGAGLSGMEWVAGIPGTLGGAIRGNAGAFGSNMAGSVESVEAYDSKTRKIVIFKKEECNFGYRSSVFKNNPRLIVISAILVLERKDRKTIQEQLNNNLSYRGGRHPAEPSAGSCFKNISIDSLPPDFFEKYPQAKTVLKENILPAAFLINKCGLKGKKLDSAQISDIHPNFIVNIGGAKAESVKNLILLVKTEVEKKFGVFLEEEIQYLGF